MSAPVPVLRPMNVGDLLDRAINIYRQNFLTLLGIVAVVNVPVLLIQVVAGIYALPTSLSALANPALGANSSSTFVPFAVYYLAIVVSAIVAGIGYAFEAAALAVVISEYYLGHKLSFWQAYGLALRRGPPLLAALFIQGLITLTITAIAFGPVIGLGLMGPTIGNSSTVSLLAPLLLGISCLALIPALILGLFLYVRWAFVYQSIALEQLGPLRGLGRSWNLVRGSFWRVLGILFLMGIFIYVVSIVPTYAIAFGLLFIAPSPILTNLATNSFNLVLNTLIVPVQLAVLTLLYYDLRIRKEGFDLEMMAKQAEVSASNASSEVNL